MEVIIQLALMFFFIQFLVVAILMAVALLMARPEARLFGHSAGHSTLRRAIAYALHLPGRVLHSLGRRVQSMRLRSVH